jgi:hypothetical protein
MRGGERPSGNLTTNRMKENPAVEASQSTTNRKLEGLDREEGVGQLDSMTEGGGDWEAQWLDRGRRGLNGLMDRQGGEWVGWDRGRRGLALNRKNGYLPVDTAGEGHEEGQHGNKRCTVD